MIFFDIDGTLIDHASASATASLRFFDHFCGSIPFSREEFPRHYEEILNRHFDRFCRGEISIWQQRRDRMRDVFVAPDMTDAEADSRYLVFIREYETLTEAYEDAVPCIESLTSRPLGIISNGARQQQIGKLQRAGLLKYFSVMVFSEDVGLGKPAPSIFIEACRRAGANPDICTHIGDNIEADVIPSRALGMRGVCLDRNRSLLIDAPVISSLVELSRVLN